MLRWRQAPTTLNGRIELASALHVAWEAKAVAGGLVREDNRSAYYAASGWWNQVGNARKSSRIRPETSHKWLKHKGLPDPPREYAGAPPESLQGPAT